jgi:hypothetical protein
MKRLSVLATVSVLALAAAPLLAEGGVRTRRPLVVQRPGSSSATSADKTARANPSPATAAGYSVQLNIVTRVQGTSFFRTAVDISNNTTTDNVVATYQYCYTLNGVYQGCTTQQSINLLALDNFHTDDIVAYLGSQNLLAPGASDLSFGTFIVTFANLPSGNGWEGTVTGRTYSPYDQNNPAAGTVAIAYPATLFFESASGSLVGIVRDTRPAPTDAGALRTNLGITNTALFDTTNPVQVQISLYDVTENSATNGQRVGNILSRTLSPGEVQQINDLFTTAAVPANVTSCIVFVDVVGPINQQSPPTVEGYVNILDGGTQDGAYFELKCSAGCATFN